MAWGDIPSPGGHTCSRQLGCYLLLQVLNSGLHMPDLAALQAPRQTIVYGTM